MEHRLVRSSSAHNSMLNEGNARLSFPTASKSSPEIPTLHIRFFSIVTKDKAGETITFCKQKRQYSEILPLCAKSICIVTAFRNEHNFRQVNPAERMGNKLRRCSGGVHVGTLVMMKGRPSKGDYFPIICQCELCLSVFFHMRKGKVI